MATFRAYRPSGGLGIAPENSGLVRPCPALTLDDKRALCATPVTLNGAPAVITGAMEKTALVIAFDGAARAEYSWPAVARITANGGRFGARP
jgi:hypothetical protein